MLGTHFLGERNEQQINRLRLICFVCGDPNCFNRDGFWRYAICHTHNPSSWPSCSGCLRLKRRNLQFIDFGDGRILCPDCQATTIMDITKLKPLVKKMHKFYEERLSLKVPKNVPILLVDTYEMNKTFTASGTYIHPERLSYAGCTTFRAKFVINSITSSSVVGENVHVEKKAQPQSKSPVSILLLFGYPEVRMGGTLAHEMMHAWLRLKRRSLGRHENFDKSIEEGLCELMSYKWWEWLESTTSDSADESTWQGQFERRLIAFSKWDKETDRREIYGYGFRAAKQAVDKFGLKATLKSYTHTNSLPQ